MVQVAHDVIVRALYIRSFELYHNMKLHYHILKLRYRTEQTEDGAITF